jgi:hypothetical protein
MINDPTVKQCIVPIEQVVFDTQASESTMMHHVAVQYKLPAREEKRRTSYRGSSLITASFQKLG